jgi:hypothetical protein
VKNLHFAGRAAFQQQSYTPLDDVQGLLLLACCLSGKPSPWDAEAEAGNYQQCALLRAEVFAAAAAQQPDRAAACLLGEWLAELPPVLKQLAAWALPRSTASVADLSQLQATLQVHMMLLSQHYLTRLQSP